jgi:hypothetical protein
VYLYGLLVDVCWGDVVELFRESSYKGRQTEVQEFLFGNDSLNDVVPRANMMGNDREVL